jgi:hypothetical protein
MSAQVTRQVVYGEIRSGDETDLHGDLFSSISASVPCGHNDYFPFVTRYLHEKKPKQNNGKSM